MAKPAFKDIIITENSASQNKVSAANSRTNRPDEPLAPPKIVLPGAIPPPGSSVPFEQGMGTGPGGSGDSTPPPDGGGGGGGDASTSKDWADIFWSSLGLPQSLINQINGSLSGVSDDATAQAMGTNILRSSQWYQTTFPGIAYGIRNGLFTDEQGYRDYVNKLNVLYNQYQGRSVNTNEVTDFLQKGLDASIVNRQLQGQAITQAEAPALQYATGAFDAQGPLNQQELTAYGQEKAGLDSSLGQTVMNRVAQAQEKMKRIFEGTLATPSLTLGPQGLYSPSLQGNKSPQDIGA